ncbi:MAG: helix-turn-helix domain-containing protein [Opitutaceae bacterium]|nr:helix-turn-helix domain-containing protein [Opitutaceae bacterium]
MAQDTIKKIAEYKTRLADLERELFAQLAQLPAQYGFASAEEFIAAFRQAVAGKPGRKPGKAAKAAKVEGEPKAEKPAKAAKRGKGGRKARVKITPEIIAEVKSLAEGGKTGKEIAKATGISLPSVQNLKKKLGLVAKR